MKKSFYFVVAFGIGCGAFVGASFQEHMMRPKIIENGGGHYDQISGEFQWGAPLKLASNYAKDMLVPGKLDATFANSTKGSNQ